jgi:tetratricopeptide (TPR) repeat protein
MYFYLKGYVNFRKKNYEIAEQFFERAMHYNIYPDNELYFQYYGQTLLCLSKHREAFHYLIKSYDIYENIGWEVGDYDEYRLAKDTLRALKYIDDNYGIKGDNVSYDKQIIRCGIKG